VTPLAHLPRADPLLAMAAKMLVSVVNWLDTLELVAEALDSVGC